MNGPMGQIGTAVTACTPCAAGDRNKALCGVLENLSTAVSALAVLTLLGPSVGLLIAWAVLAREVWRR